MTVLTRTNFCHSDQLLMRRSETRTLNAANSTPHSFQAIWLGRATKSDEHIVGTAQDVCTARSARAKNDQDIWNSGLINTMKGTPWAPRGEDSQAEIRVPEERHRPMIGWNTNTRILREFWDEMGKTAGYAACASPEGKKHSVA